MGIYYSNNNLNNSEECKKENLEPSAPEFYLNKKFPNYYNLSIEQVIQNFLKSKYDLLENNQLTTSLSKEFNLLFTANSIISNNSIENKNSKKSLFSKKSQNLPKTRSSNGIQNEKNEIKEDSGDKIYGNPENISFSNNNNENNKAMFSNIEKNNVLKNININLDSSDLENNYNNKKKKDKFFLSDYNIYSCNDSHRNNNNKIIGENSSDGEERNIIFINNEANNSKINDKGIENNLLEEEENENENIFDNLSNKTEYDNIKGNNDIENNKIEEIIKNLKDEDGKNKSSNKSISKHKKSSKKMRKYTEIEPILIATKAASLMKDIRKEYKFKNCLGGGHFGTVRKAFKKTDKDNIKYYAIKSIPMKNLSNNIDDFVKEVDIISTLDHPNVIKFYETYHDKCFFHIVMELCKGKEILYEMTNNGCMEEKKVVNIIVKVLLAIAHCHNRGVTHRDLKPENILFDSMKPEADIKLIDFGLSRKYDKEQKMHSILGTPYYVAPEVLKGEYDEKCDIWSIGAVTYLLLCGEPPFTGNSNNEIFKKIVNDNIKFNFQKWKNISNNAKDFVRMCLKKNCSKRPSAGEALKHPWFSNVLKEIHNLNGIKKEILINVKNFNINYQLKKMVLKYLINTLTEDEKKSYKDAFYAVDFNHNGFILPEELKQAYNLLKINVTDEQINNLFNILPKNKKLGIGYSEFIMAGVDQKKLFTKENLEDSFNYFDINKTGFIEYDNLNSALLRMGKKYVNSDDIISIIKDVVKNIKNEKEYENKEKYYKISKEDFMKIFSI